MCTCINPGTRICSEIHTCAHKRVQHAHPFVQHQLPKATRGPLITSERGITHHPSHAFLPCLNEFSSGQPQHQQWDQLAATFARRCPTLNHLLGVLSTSSQPQHPQPPSTNPGAGSSSGGGIRRFCSITDVQRCALCIMHTGLRTGSCSWQLGHALEALNALVASAGPSFVAQPDLLLKVTQIYTEAEEQLLLTLQQQAAADPRGVAEGLLPAPVRPAPPPAICAALDRAQAMPALDMNHPVALWLVGRSGQLPSLVQRLLVSWVGRLLPPAVVGGAAVAGGELTDGAEVDPADEGCSRQQVEAAAAALASAPEALPLLAHAAAGWERILQEQHHTSRDAAAAAAAAAHSALLSALLGARPQLLLCVLQECQLPQLLRRQLLEHGGRQEAGSCAVVAGCCSLLLVAARCVMCDVLPLLLQAAGPLVSKRLMADQKDGGGE